MDVVHPYGGVLFNCEKDRTSDACYSRVSLEDITEVTESHHKGRSVL